MSFASREEAPFEGSRSDFPSLGRTHNGYPLAYFDGPAGTQVPRSVIEAVASYYGSHNANTHGQFPTSKESDRMLEETRGAIADFLGAPSGRLISLGANMTTLTFSLSRAIARALKPGDEILITQLDHEANRGPWLTLRERGMVIREISVKQGAVLDYEDFAAKVSGRTKVIAMGLASNAFGTVNDVARARRLASQAGAWLFVDAVHYAPHFPIDVGEMGVDFLVCSAYKFYGPHVGILYARDTLLEGLEADRLRVQDPHAPYRIETGTQNHAAIAGVKAALEYLAGFGTGVSLRTKLHAVMDRLSAYEHAMAKFLYEGLKEIRGVTVHGQTFDFPGRAPTLAFTLEGMTPLDVCSRLADRGICAWDGHFYAVRPMEVLGLLERGGVTRVGVSMYNTREEGERLLEEVRAIARTRT